MLEVGQVVCTGTCKTRKANPTTMFLRGLFIHVRIGTKNEHGIFSPILLSDPSSSETEQKGGTKKKVSSSS